MAEPGHPKPAMKLALTHYDILNVARNASPDVIRATYRTLCRKYHPDLNAGSTDSTRMMAIINVSYDILSSAARRQAYDDWLAEQESLHGRMASASADWRLFTLPAGPLMSRLAARTAFATSHARAAVTHISRYAGSYMVAGLALAVTIAAFVNPDVAPAQPDLALLVASPPLAIDEPHLALITATAISPGASRPASYVRPRHAPSGQAWPTQAGYLKNTQILDNSGHAIVKVENAANSSDVHVKLVALRGLREYPVREFYIPAHGSFTVENLSPGLYDVRYRDLDNGRLARSEEFMIAEGAGVKGALQAKTTVTLDKIQRNRVEIFALLETEF